LAKGQDEIGFTFGGPTVMVGNSPTPLPNAVLEARTGLSPLLDKPLDLNYGLNATALAFGLVQGHIGSSWLLRDQTDWIPALSISTRLFLGANFFNRGDKADDSIKFWVNNQWELIGSWLYGQQLIYVGLAEYLDFQNPGLTLSPFLGVSLDPGDAEGLKLQVEMRWYAINQTPKHNTVRWYPESVGALGGSLGVSYAF